MTTPLEKKLQIKPGSILHVLNVPEDLKPWLSRELNHIPLEFNPSENMAAVMIFVRNKRELEQAVFPILSKLDGRSLVWLVYPKGTSGVETDINRDILWKSLEPSGWRPARMVALDNVWSCMRFSLKPVKN